MQWTYGDFPFDPVMGFPSRMARYADPGPLDFDVFSKHFGISKYASLNQALLNRALLNGALLKSAWRPLVDCGCLGSAAESGGSFG